MKEKDGVRGEREDKKEEVRKSPRRRSRETYQKSTEGV